MPKHCSVPNCKNDSGPDSDRKSFYKFPLQDADRLRQWLRNMGRVNWTPSRHHYVCHQHFAPECFKMRWGIRYLENDAVPTVFQKPQKPTTADESEQPPAGATGSETVLQDGSMDAGAAETLHTVHLYEVAVTPWQQGDTGMVESSDGSLHTELKQSATQAHFPLALLQKAVSDGSDGTEVVVVSQCVSSEEHEELVAALLTQGHQLVIEEPEAAASLYVQELSRSTEQLPSVTQEGQEVMAYFETLPNVLPSDVFAQWSIRPDTVLSSALSSKPITSTVPIVSTQRPPPPQALSLKVDRLDTDEGEGDDGQSEEDSMEWQDHQLEEHCYHKSSLSKEQLEVIVSALQKKVKMLQQRHRRHLDKLVGLENCVSQLRQNQLLNQERLQLLERAYLQTGGETVAIIYEEDDGARHLIDVCDSSCSVTDKTTAFLK